MSARLFQVLSPIKHHGTRVHPGGDPVVLPPPVAEELVALGAVAPINEQDAVGRHGAAPRRPKRQ